MSTWKERSVSSRVADFSDRTTSTVISDALMYTSSSECTSTTEIPTPEICTPMNKWGSSVVSSVAASPCFSTIVSTRTPSIRTTRHQAVGSFSFFELPNGTNFAIASSFTGWSTTRGASSVECNAPALGSGRQISSVPVMEGVKLTRSTWSNEFSGHANGASLLARMR